MIKVEKFVLDKARQQLFDSLIHGDAIHHTLAYQYLNTQYFAYDEEKQEWQPFIGRYGSDYPRKVYKIIGEDKDSYILQEVSVVTLGGRCDGIIELDHDEIPMMLTSKGWYCTPADDLVVVFNHGEVSVYRGKIVEETPATVHGAWKIRRNQLMLIIKQYSNVLPKYLVYTYSDGSYSGCTVLIKTIDDNKTVYQHFDRYYIKTLDNLKKGAVIRSGKVIDIIEPELL